MRRRVLARALLAPGAVILILAAWLLTAAGVPAVQAGAGGLPAGLEVYAVAGTVLPAGGNAYPALPPGAAGYATVGRWDKNPVTYSLENCPVHLDCGTAFDILRQALEAWDTVSGLSLDEVGAGRGDIRITFGMDDLLTGAVPLDGPGGILGYSYFPYPWLGSKAGDIYLDPDEFWVAGTPARQEEVHLLTVAMHEAGHSLGLDHTSDPGALMWAEYEGVRGLGPDDIAGIQALYGPPPSAEGAASAVTANATVNLRIRSGPGTGYSQIGTLPYQAGAPVLGRNSAGDWLYIDYNGLRGWIAGWLAAIQGDVGALPVVSVDGTAAVPPIPPANPGSSAITATALDTLRIRSGPGTAFDAVGRLPYRAAASVIGRNTDGSWLLIQYQGVQGWVAAWYCRLSGGSLDSVPVTG